jgi:hypothetical protein
MKEPLFTAETLNIISYVSLGIVVLCFIVAWAYFQAQRKKDHLIEKRRWIENLPTLISSIGVLGTFAGITLGLINFDPNNLDESIPLLLGGLKTAFFTSLAGMLGSMVLSKIVSSGYDDKDKGVSDINHAAGLITQSVSNMEKANAQKLEAIENTQKQFVEKLESMAEKQNGFFSALLGFLQEQSKNQQEIRTALSVIANHANEAKTILGTTNAVAVETAASSKATSLKLEATNQKLDDLNNAIDGRLESITISVGNVEEAVGKQTSAVNNVNENVAEIVEAATGTYSTQNEIIEEIKKLSPVIRDEVTEIEEKMSETNVLLTEKFAEFSELLKKSNTEALVEVMKGVTEEFEKQMNALISKLIQENFEQLNQSVATMVQWQQDNKDMIEALTAQYKQMNTDFKQTSTTLQTVGNDTKKLVSDGSKLQQIIEGLELVMAQDKTFVATAESMKKAAQMNEKNMQEYQEYTRNLNVWVQKQRDFVEGVKDLIKKLEDLDKLRDFNGDFWKETKKNLEEGLGLVKNAAFFQRKELENMDQHFYNRLGETLAQLDECIQAMVKQKR